jgi:hypothetical protein
MTKEQGKTYEYCVRLDFPMEQRVRMMTESEQIRTALEAFERRLSGNGRPRIKVLRMPKILPEYEKVTLVFSVLLEEPEPSPVKAAELRKQIETHYFDTFPPEWQLSILSKVVDGEYVPYF